MATITLNLTDALVEALTELASRCSESDQARDGGTTHGPLDVKLLLELLAEDAAMVISRPGSWEGAGMSALLNSHGYEV